MSILVKNVTKTYKNQKALNDISFKIKKGEIVGFLGPNGAGKSTTMKILTCYIPPSQGTAEVCGLNVLEEPEEVKKKIGYLPEHNPLYLDMYVKEYLGFVANIHQLKNIKKRVDEIIEIVGLQREKNKKIVALSKGYRQRIGIAQAMIHDPEVLILDEPTSGLDPNQLDEIRNLIKRIGQEKTVLLSTHIMQEVEAICDRVIIINKGKLVADDTSEHLTQSTTQEQVVNVEFYENIDSRLLKKLPFIATIKHIKGNSYTITSTTKEDLRYQLAKYALEKQLIIISMHKEQNLESTFKQLTKNK
jgi:ABC-2 type transport system ATP-binding protein